MELENIMLSKTNHTQKDPERFLSYVESRF